jgi:uncharacterized protein HemY
MKSTLPVHLEQVRLRLERRLENYPQIENAQVIEKLKVLDEALNLCNDMLRHTGDNQSLKHIIERIQREKMLIKKSTSF